MYDAVSDQNAWDEIGAIIFDLQNSENIPEENRRFRFDEEGKEGPNGYGTDWLDITYCRKGYLATVGLRHDGHWELWAS